MTLPRTRDSHPLSRPAPARTSRLLLVGGGHAHLEVLRRYGLERPAGMSAMLVSAAPVHLYSGMLTGYIAGEYELKDLSFPLEALAAWAGVEFILGSALRVHPHDRAVSLADGRRLPYDAVSFNVGSEVADSELPGVARHALLIKPLNGIAAIPAALDRGREARTQVLVVGGGAAGVELALCVEARLARSRRAAAVAIVEQGERLLPELGRKTAAVAARACRRRGIAVELGTRIVRVEEGVAWSSRGGPYPFDVLIWAAGPRASRLFAESGLPMDAEGYLRVGRSLQSPDCEGVFGAGDCVSLDSAPEVAKTGVYAVREGPVLWRSLRAYLSGGAMPEYRAQRHYLYALNTGDGRAILGRRAFWSHSRWARWLKERIDRRFMRRYLGLIE